MRIANLGETGPASVRWPANIPDNADKSPRRNQLVTGGAAGKIYI